MNTEFKLNIGMEKGAGAFDAYTRVNFDFQLQGDKIATLTEELQKKTGKFRIPMLIFDFPESAKDFKLKIFENSSEVAYEEVSKDGHVFKCLDLLHPEFTSFKKKIEKLFSKVNELNNKIYLHMDFYNIDSYEKRLKEKHDYAPVGKISLDPNFITVLTECISRISPKFAESPIMALLPLFGGIDCQLELDSLNQLQKSNQEELFSQFSYQEPDDDEEGKRTKQMFQNREKVNIYLSFGVIGILKIELQVRMLAFYKCLE